MRVGIFDKSHFVSDFKTAYQFTPTEFRRRAGMLVLLALAACVGLAVVWFTTEPSSVAMAQEPPEPQVSTANQIGRLTSSGNGSRRTAYEYDNLGRTTRTVHSFDGQIKEFTATYGYPQGSIAGPGSVVISQTFPDNERIDYTYDKSGAQQSIKTTPFGAPQQTIVSSIFRNARGQTIRAEFGNNAVTTYTYNDIGDLRLLQSKTLIAGVRQQEFNYGFDPTGNVISVVDGVNSTLSADYTYDSLNQLISMTSQSVGGTLNYSYDRTGNLVNKEGIIQSYGGAQSCTGCAPSRGPHALGSVLGVTFNYDLNGNLISTSNGTDVTWNAENMATRVVQGGATIYRKAFLGESVWKKVESGLTTYYLPSMLIENGQSRKFFASFAERSPDGQLRFYHGDHLGSTSLMTNIAGTIIRNQAYMPYGADRFVSGSFTPRYQFNFKEKETTGFYDYGARLYNPATGRWLSPDTVSADGLNRYAYVRNNPLRYTDPTGHQLSGLSDSATKEIMKHLWEAIEKKLKGKVDKAIKGKIQKLFPNTKVGKARAAIVIAILDYLVDPTKDPIFGFPIPGGTTGGQMADFNGRVGRIMTKDDFLSGMIGGSGARNMYVLPEEYFFTRDEKGQKIMRFGNTSDLLSSLVSGPLGALPKNEIDRLWKAINNNEMVIITTFEKPQFSVPTWTTNESVPNVSVFSPHLKVEQIPVGPRQQQ